VHLPDGEVRVLGVSPREELDLPPGSEVELVEGDRRRYRGHLVVEQRTEGNVATLETPLDTYLAGVVVSEIGAAAPDAALAAQAIVSRTLVALGTDRHPGDPWTLCDLTHCQSFRGETEVADAHQAVEDTRGRVLTVLGRVVEAPFHSTCGGQTLSAREVWGSEIEHLPGVSDRGPDGRAWCAASPHQQWTAAILDDGLPDPRTDRDRFRTAVGRAHGWNLVKSNRFTATLVTWKGATVWHLEGVGLGHSVGLCQQGAVGRALAGMGADEILVAYYPGAVATTVPTRPAAP
jgi:stage II sporulation protein D